MHWPLLAPLPERERRELVASARLRRYARDEIVFHEGDPGGSLHLLKAGRVAVQVSTPHGDTATLNVLSAGACFGELTVVRGRPLPERTATVVALEPVETLMLSGQEFQALCRRHPQTERLVVELLADRVEALSQRLLENLYLTLDHRVCRRLLELAEIYTDPSDSVDCPVTIPITQTQIAGLAGATRPSINQVLRRLVAKDIVSVTRGRVTVEDRTALRRRAAL